MKIWTPPKPRMLLPGRDFCPRCKRPIAPPWRRPRLRRSRRLAQWDRRVLPFWRRGLFALGMADGDLLLDDDGDAKVQDDGATLSDGTDTGCGGCGCACSSGKKCFQEWIAAWSCADQAWSGPVTDNRVCLAEGTDTGWVKIAGDASGCTYRKRVPYEPAHCCTVNGDCGVGLGNTATPALPFGGGVPNDCCVPCVGMCGCRRVGPTATVMFEDVLNDMPCTQCGFIWAKAGTTTLGTYTLIGGVDAFCAFGAGPSGDLFDVASDMGAGCPPDEAFSGGETDFHIDLGFDVPTGTWILDVFAEDFQLFYGEVDQGDCTEPLVFENVYTDYDVCGTAMPQTFAIMIGGTATVVFPPCVPA